MNLLTIRSSECIINSTEFIVKCIIAICAILQKGEFMTITAKMRELGNNRKFSKKFTKGTRVQQVAFQKAVLAATVGTSLEALESIPLAGADTGTPLAAGTYSDATLRFSKAGKTDSYPFEQLTNSVAIPGGEGFVDITDPLMVAIEAAYIGSDNATGWTLFEGEYKR